MKMHLHRIGVLLGVVAMLYSYEFAHAGTIEGTVYSYDGRTLADVVVRAKQSAGTHFDYDARTDASGHYRIQSIATGEYIVRVVNVDDYVDEYYNNVLNPADAVTIKISPESIITGIDFHLDQGGFIRGIIRTPNGDIVRDAINVGFYDAREKIDRGYAMNNRQGEYISPALPAGRHIILAGNPGLGYITTYYKNSPTWDMAYPVTVTVGDTVDDIDFQLAKGGAIKGLVLDDGQPAAPISAWVVVEDWETHQWCSEANSSWKTGEYCAAGLAPGNYRIYIFSVDPTKYHTAEIPYPVVVTSGDTIPNINFSLTPVTYTKIQNEFIEVMVTDKYPGTNFSMQTLEGLPNTFWDDNKPLLFGHPWPHTSYTTLKVEDEVAVFGSDQGEAVVTNGQRSIPTAIQLGNGDPAVTWSWTYKNVRVDQTISLTRSEWSVDRIEDTAELRYTITNNGAGRVIGLRILFDTMLGENDGAPIKTADGDFVQMEQEFIGAAIPEWWTAIEGDPTRTIFSAQGTLKKYDATVPDRFAILRWRDIFRQPWDYTLNDTSRITFDSAVAMWWEPVFMQAGESKTLITYYGLGKMLPDSVAPYLNPVQPLADALDAPLDKPIIVEVHDDYRGVEVNSIHMWVNNAPVMPAMQIGAENKIITLTWQPNTPFLFNNHVTVRVTAQDMAYTPNAMDESYQFSLQRDVTPPRVVPVYPLANSTNDVKQLAIQFMLADTIAGVDWNTIQVHVQNNPLVPTTIDGDMLHTRILMPELSFAYNDTVSVTVAAADKSNPPNAIQPPYFYRFFIAQDTLGPVIAPVSPTAGQTNVPLNTNISFKVTDDRTGVADVRLYVDAKNAEPLLVDGSTLTFHPAQQFMENDTINIRITAKDRAQPGNASELKYQFYTLRDSLPPWTSAHQPAKSAEQVPRNTAISMTIQDDMSGVDTSFVNLRVNGGSVVPSFQKLSQGYRISWQPDTLFQYNQIVSVRLTAQDYARHPNQMNPDDYSFSIIEDKQPPILSYLTPAPGDTGVLPSAHIAFRLTDAVAGVDTSAVGIVVNDVSMASVLEMHREGDVWFVSSHMPPNQAHGQQIRVRIHARDLSHPANLLDSTYTFKLTDRRDRQAPFTYGHHPTPGQTNVRITDSVAVHLADLQSGVDLQSIKMRINGRSVRPMINGFVYDYQLMYKPATPFSYGDSVTVEIDAADLADTPNIMPTEKYVFYPETDVQPPVIRFISPGDSAVEVPVTSSLQFEITDTQSGVDAGSIQLRVNNEIVQPNIAGTPKYTTVEWKPENRFAYNQQIRISANAADLIVPPNKSDAEFIFWTRVDTIAPYIVDMQPAPGETNVLNRPTILFRLLDDVAGVSQESIQVQVNNIDVTPDISGTPNEFIIEYTPDTGFASGEKVTVRVDACDLSEPANCLQNWQSYFFIREALPDLVASISADSTTLLVHSSVNVHGQVIANEVDVEQPFDMKFEHKGEIIDAETVNNLPVSFEQRMDAAVQFDTIGRHLIRFTVDPDNRITESDETNNVVDIYIRVNEGELRLSSNPFTPNNDGFNDEVEFDFSRFQLSHPSLKVFDMQGRPVITLHTPSASTFVWDGMNRDRQLVLPGVYLYVLQDGDRHVSRGYVVLAR
ncbi:carboxypeptidase regulatory-like domain-containing protein [candidate division KSB1 bacterium]|nr:carboxypeptidase regulatory-like domain-containing protein [candidate division KSB1 bacterium]